MLKIIGDFTGLLAAILSLSLLFLLSVYETKILESMLFISIAIIFDILLFVSHLLILIASIRNKSRNNTIAFSLSISVFISGMVVLMIIGKDPRFLLCLYNALIVIFYGLYFYFDAKKTAN